MNFRDKSLTDLRQIAIGFGVKDVFGKTREELESSVLEAQRVMSPPPRIEIETPKYDARLMNKPPSKKVNKEDLKKILEPYEKVGLELRFDEERWYMKYKARTDEGNLRMPMAAVMRCAQSLMD